VFARQRRRRPSRKMGSKLSSGERSVKRASDSEIFEGSREGSVWVYPQNKVRGQRGGSSKCWRAFSNFGAHDLPTKLLCDSGCGG